MRIIDGGITAAKGFASASCAAGIKYSGRNDMAMVRSSVPCRVAGVFTTNLVKAAPVLWDKAVAEKGTAEAIVINAGIANACTGKEGMDYCKKTALAVKEELGIPFRHVLVASTGVIGMQLPIGKIEAGVKKMSGTLSPAREAATESAKAIMTTDTRKKEAAVTFKIGGKTVTMGGMCKGSGMIHPNMCTMLGFVTTDCLIDERLLKKALREDVADTFNMISVDGDTSTNDTLLLLANGEAKNPEIKKEGPDYETFKKALRCIDETLAKMMAGDGEGATALFEVKVRHARSKKQAKTLAKSVITSTLTKAAIFGHDANWGRILCALGYSGEKFNPDKTELSFQSKNGKILIFKNGVAADYSEEEATKILSCDAVTAIVDIHAGKEEATAWGCDLSYDYVKINADYRS